MELGLERVLAYRTLTDRTHVVSAPKRIQRKRTKGWRMPEGAIYVGRPSRWGNPFRWNDYPSLVLPLGAEEWVGVSKMSRRRFAVANFEALVKGWVDGPKFEWKEL